MPTSLSLDDFIDTPWHTAIERPRRKVKVYNVKVKLKFNCDCGQRSWTSMRGVARFRLGLSRSGKTHYISCLLYDQQCKKCARWCTGRIYDQEFQDMVAHVIDKYLQPKASGGKAIRGQPGNPRRPHDKRRCEACALGVCTK